MTLSRALKQHSLPFLVGWGVRRTLRLLTGRWRTLPDFVIIGGQHSAPLYNYLVENPAVVSAFMKEVHFLDRFTRGTHMRATSLERDRRRAPLNQPRPRPYSSIHPHAPPAFIRNHAPGAAHRMFQNPVDRALSQYRHRSGRV